MAAFYWFALVVGAGLLLFSLLGDTEGGADGVDADLGVDVDADGGHAHHGYEVLSIRTATYFLFGFGASGVLLGLAGSGPLTRLLTALLVGTASGGISAAAFGWLRRTQSGDLLEDHTLVGLVGRVTLPLGARGTGKVEVVRGGRAIELLARPFDAEPEAPEAWTTVVIIDIEHGTALVSPYEEAIGPADAPPALPQPPED